MDLNAQLDQLRKALEAGHIGPEEFDRLKAQLLVRFGGTGGYVPSPATVVEDPGRAYVPAPVTRLDDLAGDMEIGPPGGRFRLIRRIGAGGMGHVWLARDLGREERLGGERLKALKLVHPQLQDHGPALERLKAEAERAADLSHQHIVNVLDWRQGPDGWLFVIMEYLEGQNLAERLHAAGGRGLPVDVIHRLLPPIAQALDHAHEHKVLHRDLKPANIFLCTDGGLKLLDFGLAAELHTSASALKQPDASGTCEYMAPEAHRLEPATRAQDIYALACVVYEMFTGHPPLSCDAAVKRALSPRPGPLPKLSEALSDATWKVLARGLAHDRKRRPAIAAEFTQALLAALKPRGEPTPKDQPKSTPSPRRWWMYAATALVLGAGILVWQIQRESKDLETGSEIAEPEMVAIPGGNFRMGCVSGKGCSDDEKPVHKVTNKPFKMGKYEVTVAEYAAFLNVRKPGGREREAWVSTQAEDGAGLLSTSNHLIETNGIFHAEKGHDRHPVNNVSWQGAQAYAQWLSKATGKHYRLPTEAEWEYATRGGTETQYWWGDQAPVCRKGAKNGAMFYDNKECNGTGSEAVGSYGKNPRGLYDVHGNLWEWVRDCWHEDYTKAPADGSAWEENCSGAGRRVVRGGSWGGEPVPQCPGNHHQNPL